jgi:muconolactone D-isomerase
MEFLVKIELGETGLPEDQMKALADREAEVGTGYRDHGVLLRIWRLPGRRASLSLWRVEDADQLHELVSGFPLFPWMDVEVTALAGHYLEDRRT